MDRKGRAPSQLQVSIFSVPLIALITTKYRKGRAPCQLQASILIFSDFDSLATKFNAIDRKGRAPSQLQVSIFSDPLIALIATKCNQQKGEGPQSATNVDIFRPFDSLDHYQMQSTERGGPPVIFKYRYFSTL